MAGKSPSLRESYPGLRHVLRHLAPFVRPERKLVLGGAAAMVAAVLAKLAEPWPLKFVLDMLAGGENASGAMEPMWLLVLCGLGVVLAMTLRASFEYAARIAFALAGARVLAKVRAALFEHLQRLPLSFHQKARPGDLTLRLISDVGMLKETAVTAAMPLVVNCLVVVGMVSIMLIINWQLALIAVLPLPLLWLTSQSTGRKIQTVSRTTRKTEGAMAATASEAMSNVASVQAMGLEKAMSSSFLGNSAAELKQGVKSKRLAAGLERRVDILLGLAIALVLAFGGKSVVDGRMSPGDLVVFLTYLKNTFKPVRDYSKYATRLAKATAAGERVVTLLETRTSLPEPEKPKALARPVGGLSFRDVHVSRGGRPVLQGVSFAISPGERVALVGQSGAGKSTLLSLAMRLHDPDAGEVRLGQQDVRNLALGELRSAFGYVAQEPVLFHASIRDNITIAANGALSDAEIAHATTLAGAHDFVAAMPDRYNTILSERGASLSGGQRQRLCFARAALRDPDIYLLDEPTTGLDSASEAKLAESIWALSAGKTLLIVTHDLDLAARADRVICLDQGKIAGDAPHGVLLTTCAPYRDLWGARTRRDATGYAAE